MDLRQLRYFIALAEELHFGRAAERVNITQPPLSASIKAMEEELGVVLFERTRRHVALTHAGKTLLEEAHAIVARTNRAVDLVQRADRGEVGRLTIGFLPSIAQTLLPLIIRQFTEDYPEIALDLRELGLNQQLEALRRGDIQVGLLRLPAGMSEFHSDVIFEEPFVLAMPATHPLRELSEIPVNRLEAEPFVMFPRRPGLVFHDQIMSFCLGNGFSPMIVQEALQTHTVLGLVSAGIGVAMVPDSSRSIGIPAVRFRPFREATPLARVALVWRRNDTSPVLDEFLKTARYITERHAEADAREPAFN